MPSVKVSLPLAVLSIGLSACGIPSPDPGLWQPDPLPCPRVGEGEPVEGPQIFVMSSSLPDCSNGEMTFSTFRSHRGPFFGETRLAGPEDNPAESHKTALYPDRASWLEEIEMAVAKDGGSAGRLAVYVHGYNNSFEDALRTGEILRRSFDVSIPTVVLSWPSRARAQSYLYDEASIGWAQQYHSEVLAALAEKADDITLVSHSMGGRALIQSVLDLDARDPIRARHVRRLAIVSPDVDRDRMLRGEGELDSLLTFGGTSTGPDDRRAVIIYTSSKDRPLQASRFAHGYARLGSTRCKYSVNYAEREAAENHDCHATIARPGFWIVDTSDSPGPDSGFFRHSDVFESCTGRADLRDFLAGRVDEKRRFPLTRDDGRVGWKLVRDPALERDGECIVPEPAATPKP